jgi:hypothetical protein
MPSGFCNKQTRALQKSSDFKDRGNIPGRLSAELPEGQAKSRIKSNGYPPVSGLKKDDQGVWRARGRKICRCQRGF